MAAVTPVAGDADATVIRDSWADPDRFAALYDRYAAQLYRYAYQRVGQQVAEDVVADTFLAAFGQRTSYDLARPDARPWLYGILTRKLARHHRRERADYRALARSVPDGVVDGPADRVAARVTAAAARAPLAAALAGLSAADRDVLLLFAWGQLSYDEIATALRIPVGTVRSRLNRARRKVREALGDADPARDDHTDDLTDDAAGRSARDVEDDR
jgi:RNA polymerase sigma factor (sigma-70 family)